MNRSFLTFLEGVLINQAKKIVMFRDEIIIEVHVIIVKNYKKRKNLDKLDLRWISFFVNLLVNFETNVNFWLFFLFY